MSQLHVKVFLLLSFLCLHSENSTAQAADATVEGAQNRYEQGDYFGAMYEYERAMKIDSINLQVLYGYGKTLLAVNNPKEASIYLKKPEN